MARIHALIQNLSAWKCVRGARTISEQVVRMIHPRPRTVWSRWIEGFEARNLEKKHPKDAILEFYLNQIPYSANRRGIYQAAQYYFNRSPDTLSLKEMLALIVLVRAPSYYDLYRKQGTIDPFVTHYARRLYREGMISKQELTDVETGAFEREKPGHDVDAGFFARVLWDMPSI